MTQLIPRFPSSITTLEIKEKLDNRGYSTSLRTIQRDLNELSGYFPIVIYDENKSPYGWSWKKESPGYEFPAMDPVQALTFSLASQHLEPLMPKASFKRIEKFFERAENILMGEAKSKISRWRKRVKVIPESIRFKDPKINHEIRQDIYRAVFESLQIKALYRKRGEKHADPRHIHPLGIVVKGSITYLICMMDEDPVQPRYLPIHRFEKVMVLNNQKCNEPKNFNFDEFIHRSNLGFELSDNLYTFKALFDKKIAAHLTEIRLNDTQVVKEISDGRLMISARVPDTLQFEQWLMSFGSNVEVLAPKHLRKKFKLLSKNLRKIYI